MSLPRWTFRRMQPGEMNIDPIEGEFFSTEALESLADALVRESIQNSLDARRPNQPLRMRFAFSGPDSALRGESREAWLDGLMPHLLATQSGVSDHPRVDEPLSFLTVEDLGTRGLQGDPRQNEDAELDFDAPRNDFYFFWRNVGRSRKHAGELGRWGLGKTVFPAASRINAFFGYTVRADDSRALLMGQAVTKIHRLDDHRHYPYGYFGESDDGFALPVARDGGAESANLVAGFTRDFGIVRGDEPGLSVVIPYPAPEITPAALVPSIVHHYFLALMAEVLSVEVVHGSERTLLDARTLPRIVQTLAGEGHAEFEGLLKLARFSLSVDVASMAQLAIPDETRAPTWDDERLTVEQVATLRERLDAFRPIAVRVPVWVKPSSGESVISHFEVYLERDETLSRSDDHYIRDYITVTGVRGGLGKGYRCIVAVRDRPLATLLGDSENPAHTEWQERSPKFKNRYRHGPTTLRYVRNLPKELVRLLTRPTQGKDYALLRQLFSLELPTEPETTTVGPQHDDVGGSGAKSGLEVAAGKGRESFFQLQKIAGGFRVAGTGNGTMPEALRVLIAYEVRRGSPFAHYQPLDFDVGSKPIDVHAHAADVRERKGNALLVRPTASNFQIQVTGFGSYRDLRVRVTPIGPTS